MRLPILISALLTLASFTQAQVEVESAPMGGVNVLLKAGNNLIGPTFVHPSSFSGEIATFVQNQAEWSLTFSGTPFTANAFDGTVDYAKYYIEITEAGPLEGAVFDIISNTTDTLVIDGYDGPPLPAVGNSVIIRKHVTVEDFILSNASGLSGFQDSLKIFYGNQSETLLWTGTDWLGGDFSSKKELPIYPGQGVFLSNASDVTLLLSGNVKNTPTQIPVYDVGVNWIVSLAPVDKTLGDLSLAGILAPFQDSIKTYQKDGSLSQLDVYISNGSNLLSSSFSNGDTDLVPTVYAFFVDSSTDTNFTFPSATE
mgnify:CR=1 FL=1